MKNFTFLISFIFLLSFGFPLQSSAQDLETDSLALVALYNDCNGANWTGFDTWLNGPLASWEDVTVTDVEGTPRVTHVNFKNMTLTGTLPEELGNMTEMSGKIEIHNQPGLTGTFPAFIWNWTKVERMQVKWCGFTDLDVTGIENMVNLYEFNTQETPFEGEIPVEIFELPLMRDVYMEDGMWTSLPADMPIPTPTPLRRFYINGNMFTDLPDLTGMVWAEGAKIKIRNNYLTFEDIVPNMWIADDANVDGFEYSPQETIGEEVIVYADAGAEVTLESGIGGTATTVYTWIKGEDEVVGDTKDLTIASFDPATQTGSYFCLAQDTEAPGLDIMSAKKMIFENATVQDSLALVALYNDCNGANWTGFDTWLNGPLASWEDVTVTDVEGTPRVTHVNFKNMTLTGTLPEELGNMTEMSGKIEIHNQPGLTGTFPAFIWNWTKVERMQVKWCGFTDLDVTGIENMVNLYEFNTQETPFEGEIPVEIFELPLMRDVYMEDGMWTSLPADMPIPTLTPLRRFYINGNMFTDLPDLTGMVWAEGAKIKIRNNYLTFEDIVPNMWIADDANVDGFEYSPQETIGEEVIVYADAGAEVTLESGIGGTATTVYTWIKGEDEVVGDTKDLTIASFDPATQTGSYFCLAQDTEAPGLDIMSAKKMIFENATVQDSLALVALYNDCNGANWTGFDTWLNGPLASWEDVTVTDVEGTPRVTHVNFKNMTLTGTLPEELGNMTEMSGKIEIHNQPGLTGTFPAFIWNWTKVERMQVKWCGFTDLDVTGIENMVNLYEFNTQETPFEGEIPVEIFELPLMRDVYMEDGMWTSLPADMPIPTLTPLRRFYINGNMFTDLPDLTGMVWAEGAKIKIRNNYLTFEDIVPNMWIADDANVDGFEYSPQEVIGEDMFAYPDAGSEVTLESEIGGTETTVYTWMLDGEMVEGADSSALIISSFNPATQSGTYYCVGQDTEAPGLDIMSAKKMLYENATAQDSLALVALHEECGGAEWTGFDTWLNGSLSAWEGVTVSWVKNEAVTDSTQRVTHVDFKNMTLTGTLPEELGNMTEMSGKIEIHNQLGLTGTFPAFIWNWTKVERMQIKWCGFTDIDVTGIENMVNLYEFNTQETPFEGVIPAEIFELPLMRDVYMEDGKWTALPEDMPIPTNTPLRRFYINGNMFTDLPDLTGMVWAEGAKIKIRNNYLTFEDIIPNMWIADDANVDAFEYSPQELLTEKDTITIVEGEPLELTVSAGGEGNVYTWLKDGEVVAGADSDTLYIASTLKEDSGNYQAIVQNALVPGLDLMSDTFSVVVNYPVNAELVDKSFLRVNGNPVKEILSIDSDKTVETVAIYDITGRLSRKVKVNSSTIRMNVQDLKKGIYFVKLKTDSSDAVLKIVKN